MYGIYTNYRSWYFTRYDLHNETLQKVTKDDNLDLFEVSQKFDILDKRDLSLKKEVLCQVTSILEWLIILGMK